MPSSKKRSPFILTISIILISIISFALGRYSIKNTLNNLDPSKSNDCSKTTNELDLCLTNKAEIIPIPSTQYSFQQFGIYASQFENKKMTETHYNFKRNIISQKTITLDDSDNTTVSVWELKESNDTIIDRIDKDNLLFKLNTDFPVFFGYENYGNPIFISELAQEWTNNDSVINQYGLKAYYSYNYEPKNIGSVTLNYYSDFSPTYKPILVRISTTVKTDDYIQTKNHPDVLTAKDNLKNVFNSINFKK